MPSQGVPVSPYNLKIQPIIVAGYRVHAGGAIFGGQRGCETKDGGLTIAEAVHTKDGVGHELEPPRRDGLLTFLAEAKFFLVYSL